MTFFVKTPGGGRRRQRGVDGHEGQVGLGTRGAQPPGHAVGQEPFGGADASSFEDGPGTGGDEDGGSWNVEGRGRSGGRSGDGGGVRRKRRRRGGLFTARLLETQPTSAFPVVRGEGAAAGEAAAAEATGSCFEEFFEVLRVEGEFFPPFAPFLAVLVVRELLPSIREACELAVACILPIPTRENTSTLFFSIE